MPYAIHRVSKKHVDITDMQEPNEYLNDYFWVIKNTDDDGWISWTGGDCPLPVGSSVRVRSREGKEWVISECLSWSRWLHRKSKHDIVAYKPIKQVQFLQELPDVGWRGKCRNYLYKDRTYHQGQVIHKTAKGLRVVEFDNGDVGTCSAPGDFIVNDVDHQFKKQCWQGRSLPAVGDCCQAIIDGEWHQVTVAAVDHSRSVVLFPDPRIRTLEYLWQDLTGLSPVVEQQTMRRLAEIIEHTDSPADAAQTIYDAVAAQSIPGLHIDK